MVAYGFKKRFITAIEKCTKLQTIRALRKNSKLPRIGGHALPGEAVQLYTAMRTKQCRKIGDATCHDTRPIRLAFTLDEIMIGGIVRVRIRTPIKLDKFAVRDGFADYNDLCAFWREEHGALDDFSGALIEWTGFKLPDTQ